MTTFILLLAQTQGEATFVILFLLIVAAVIGYVTAWLYFKTVNKNRFDAYVEKIEKIQTQLSNMSSENSKTHQELVGKINELAHVTLELKAVRALHTEAIHELDEMKLRNKINLQKVQERDETLINIAQRKYLLNYNSFGIATENEKDDLQMISGIGPFIEERLHAIEIFTFKQISKLTAKDIENINDVIEYFAGRIERDEWVLQAKELVEEEKKRLVMLERIRANKTKIAFDRIGKANMAEANDLTDINGIGRWIKQKLNALDIYTFKQISNFTNEDIHLVTEAIEFFPGRIERDEWVFQAKQLVKNTGAKGELLKRIRSRKSNLYYDRLGIAQLHEANNLTRIKGISLWVEEQLNALDIYTFQQVSKLTHDDIKTIADILEISVERINRDNWVTQAKELADHGYATAGRR
jgi:predicted flap endonuclease-1-like 5' DNA nuclease